MGLIKDILKTYSIEEKAKQSLKKHHFNDDTIIISLQDISTYANTLQLLEKESTFKYIKDFNFFNSIVRKEFLSFHNHLIKLLKNFSNIEADNSLLNHGVMLFKTNISNPEDNQSMKHSLIELIDVYRKNKELSGPSRIDSQTPSLYQRKEIALKNISDINHKYNHKAKPLKP